MSGELTYSAQVGFLGACAEAGELKVLAHAFAQGRSPGGGHDWLLSQRENVLTHTHTHTHCERCHMIHVPGLRPHPDDHTIDVEEIKNLLALHCRVAAYLNDELKLTAAGVG